LMGGTRPAGTDPGMRAGGIGGMLAGLGLQPQAAMLRRAGAWPGLIRAAAGLAAERALDDGPGCR
jgi:hypothetical protein